MTRELALAIALAACGTHDAASARDEAKQPGASGAEQAHQTLAALAIALPQGWSARYDKPHDGWLVAAPPGADGRATTVHIERAATWSVASPDAFLHHRLKGWPPDTTADIESRAGVRGGFAMTVAVKGPGDPAPPRRETYVVRQLGNIWYQCLSESVPDDPTRDQVIALCSSLKL